MVRLASVRHNGTTKLVAQIPTTLDYVDLTSIASNVRDFFLLGTTALERANELIQQASSSSSSSSSSILTIPATDAHLLAPIDGSLVGKFLCIGMNYVDHCTEQNVPIPTEPVVFSKFGSCVVGTNVPVAKDVHTERLDYEVELGIVVGTTVPRFTSKEDAVHYIGGYTVVHDVSARDWQLEKNGGQWLLGKAMDGYAPIGPVIVTTDEMTLEKAHSTGIWCRVNGETLQQSNTDQLVFGVDDIVSFVSKFMTLYPGDIIATGTPPGVGCFRKPPRWLEPGDVVECEIDGIGTITSPIVGPNVQPGQPNAITNTAISRLSSSSLSLSSSSNIRKLGGMTCIVTGAARGIGYGIAERLGREGAARVDIVDLDPTAIDEACSNLNETVPSCHFVAQACDVGDETAVTHAWSKIAKSNGGRIDILVQAAGIVGNSGIKTEDVDSNNFDAVFRVNVNGIFNGCKAVLPYMKAKGYGRIVNIASIAGKEGNAGMLAYSASKAAVIGLTKTIGKEYAETGITCNALAPAVVRTAMVEAMPPEQVTYMTDKIPMKRCGTIDEIASMVCFMASPESSFTTGFCFDATGGRSVY
ncbi:short-chain dehydrogenase/reductase SDR [Nitzschia inconspicua]|uniref:Short-chain dehydrogenase/reductase SDR n=1 Tax=Nitzschia inconspicua TaxID=303405 RepID=A0A9K3KWC1_9STRA|nr:short-chain dehydrogenase/reductase SDR [Nitzschia inconspicua]